MSRPVPTSFTPVPVQNLAAGWPIKQGASGAYFGETDLIRNIHYAHCAVAAPMVVATLFTSGPGYVVPSTSATYQKRAQWRRAVHVDFASYRIYFAYKNTGTVNGGIRFTMASNTVAYTTTLSLTPHASWTVGTLTLAYNPAAGIDTIEMWAKNPSDGETRIASVSAWPLPLSTVASGASASGFLPLDTTEVDSNSPLHVALRQQEFFDLDVLRRKRSDTFVGWSDDIDLRPITGSAYTTDSATAVEMVIVPIPWLYRGQKALKWAVAGVATGASGTVTLRTGTMIKAGTAAVSVPLTVGLAAENYWVDDGGDTLAVTPQHSDYVVVTLAGDGADPAYLKGLSLWPEELTA